MSIRAVIFDLYGTLLDIERLVERVGTYVDTPAAFVTAWRQKQIEYAFTTSLAGRYDDFDRLTELSLAYVCDLFDLTLDGASERHLLDGWLDLPPHPDSAMALDAVGALGYPRVVLTNGVIASSQRALTSGSLHERIDEVLTVGINRVYKPSPEAYRVATERFACSANDLIFVSSNGWDAAGAASYGFRVVWCNRKSAPRERIGGTPLAELRSLAELPQTIERLA